MDLLRSHWKRILTLAGLAGFGVGLAMAPLTLCLALVVGAISTAALLRRPALGLVALALAVPFGSLREFQVGGATVGLSEVVLLGTLVSWSARYLALRERPFRRLPLTGTLLMLWGVALVAILPATNLAPALKELAKWSELLLLYLFTGSATDAQERRWVTYALLLAASLQAALGLYQFIFQVGPPGFVLFGRYMRAYGTFLQPNPFAGYLGLLLPLGYAVCWCLVGRRGSRLAGLAALAATVMLALGIVASWSRGALLGAAGGLLLVALALGRRAWPVLLLVGVMALVLGPSLAGSLPGGFLGRLEDLATFSQQDLSTVEVNDANFAAVERMAHWQAAWRMFAAHPWGGVGLGQYATFYPAVAAPRWQDPLGHAHNYYLNLLAEGGIPLLCAYLLWIGCAVVAVWGRARRSEGWERALALAALGMLGHLLIHSAVDNLYVHEMYLVVAMVLGMSTVPGAAPATRAFGRPS
jgi:O-antigen ligase